MVIWLKSYLCTDDVMMWINGGQFLHILANAGQYKTQKVSRTRMFIVYGPAYGIRYVQEF